MEDRVVLTGEQVFDEKVAMLPHIELNKAIGEGILSELTTLDDEIKKQLRDSQIFVH